jgi:hypothetical protein
LKNISRYKLGENMFLNKRIIVSFLITISSCYANAPLNLCSNAIRKVEAEEDIPKLLMQAISVVESGRAREKDKATIAAHPWTLNVNGKGEYYSTKVAAVERVKSLIKQGVKSIDVGCMQVNLGYHPDAFKNIEMALDPYHNAVYAAKFLKKLMDEQKSWSMAIGHYHSRFQPHYISYRNRVYDQWNQEKLKDAGILVNKEGVSLSKKFPYRWLLNMRPQSPKTFAVPSIKSKTGYHFLFARN